MVRHEAAEALGAIAANSVELLDRFKCDGDLVVAESCLVALDIHEYFTSDQFQYAYVDDGLADSVKILSEKKQ